VTFRQIFFNKGRKTYMNIIIHYLVFFIDSREKLFIDNNFIKINISFNMSERNRHIIKFKDNIIISNCVCFSTIF